MIKSFQLGSKKYRVKVVNSISDDILGQMSSPVGLVELSENWSGKKLTEVQMKSTLYHEMIHACLHEMCRFDLSSDETFVNVLAGFVEQFEMSKKS